MADFRRKFHECMARLDGAQERKTVALGALALLAFLSVGPTVLKAVAHALPEPAPPVPAAPAQAIIQAEQPVAHETGAATPSAGSASATPRLAVETPPPPPLSFLFPQAGASIPGPAHVAVRFDNATAIAVLFEVANPAGERVTSLPASLALSGEWSALLTAEPGEYVIGARASLENGEVVAFKEKRAFRLVAPEPRPAPADPSEPLVELAAPSGGDSFEALAPLGARVKNAQPNMVVFLIASTDGAETFVIGSEDDSSGYWTATFEGPAGAYRVRARATIGEREFFSMEQGFILESAS